MISGFRNLIGGLNVTILGVVILIGVAADEVVKRISARRRASAQISKVASKEESQ